MTLSLARTRRYRFCNLGAYGGRGNGVCGAAARWDVGSFTSELAEMLRLI